MSKRKVKLRKDLDAGALFSRVRSAFEIILDPRSYHFEHNYGHGKENPSVVFA